MWNELKDKSRPLVLYGTGNAAEKILKELDIRGIRVSGIFASDGFVRDREFAGFKVLSYAQAKERFGPMTVLLCFGSHRSDVIDTILRVDAEQDLYAPDLPIAGEGLFDDEYYEAHRAELAWVRDRLADEQSRKVFDSVIEYKLSGRIAPLLACQSLEEENWQLLRGASAQAPSFLDLGAYTGDTTELFLKVLNDRTCRPDTSDNSSQPRIIAVEPEARNFRKLQETAERLFGYRNTTDRILGSNDAAALPSSEETDILQPDSIRLVNAAVGDYCGEVSFTHGAGRGGAAEKGKARPVALTTVDTLLAGQPIGIIKMDLEGAESAAIRGAAQTITQHRPVMLISAYHRTEDLFAIPQQVLALVPDYRFYLRKDPCIPAWGVNYYFL